MAAPALNGQQQEFVRPPKSSFRNTSPANGITQSVNDAYKNAPDLGISNTVQNVYQRAPDLGIGSTVDKKFGSSTKNQDGDHSTQTDGQQSQEQKQQQQQQQQQEGHQNKELSPYEISKQKGPSNKDRLGKTQNEIGTEFGIPTRAGAGTTVSPDNTNELALKKSNSSPHTKPRQAAVPEDYAPEPCPDQDIGAKKMEGGNQHKSPKENKKEKRSSNGHNSGNQSPQSTTSSERKRRSMGAKLRDQIKGELKILSGSITNNEDKINLGLNIKHGEV